MVMETLFGTPGSTQNLSEMSRYTGISQQTLSAYKTDREKLKRGSARTVALIVKHRKLSDADKVKLWDELAK